MLRQTLRYLNRLNMVQNNPDISQNVMDHIPKAGIIGYSTNNDKLAWELLSEPSERFGFTVRDFSNINRDDTTTTEDLVRLSEAEEYEHDINDLTDGRNLQGGDPYSSKTVILNQFPDSIVTAKELEELNGGVNLFLHLNFDNNVNWEVEDKYKGCQHCSTCGVMLSEHKENSALQQNEENSLNDLKLRCNCNNSNCQLKHTQPSPNPNTNKNMAELHKYLDDQGLFVTINVRNGTDITDARIELIKTMANNFKL